MEKGLNRRGILSAGAAVGLWGFAGANAQTENSTATVSTNLKISVVLDGATYTYPDGPKIPFYYVVFHETGRVVFHLGAVGKLNGEPSPKPHHLGPHQVRIERDGMVVFDVSLPAHWWNSEWTYRPAPVAVSKSPAEIVARNRMFPFGDTGRKTGAVANFRFKGPMDSAGITVYMPTTGERPDIGLITDPSAQFMLGGDPAPMLAWAHANGSFPLHYRDEATGRPIDLLKYPQANCYESPAQGYPWFDRYPKDAQGNNILGGGMVAQQAHFVEMSYVAYLATGDLGFLENVQYNANFTILCDAAKSTSTVAILSGELRGIAWAFRNLFMAHVATQDAEARGSLPSSCYPSSHWKKILDNQLAYYSRSMRDPNQALWRLVGADGMWGPWQNDYMLTVLAFGVLTGHSDWTSLYVWALGNIIARTSGTSGFPPGYGTPYYMSTGPNGATSPRFKNWGEAFEEIKNSAEPNIHYRGLTQEVYDKLKADPLNGGKAFVGQEYMITTRAALVMANYLDKKGLASIRATYPDFDTCLSNAQRMFVAGGWVNVRTSVVS